MNKAMKRATGLVLAVAVVLVAAVALILSRADSYIVAAVERYGEATTGTPVTLSDADISLTEGRGTLSGLTIGNTEGYDEPHALEVDTIDVTLDLASLSRNVLVVKDVLVDGARLYAEQRGERNNLTELLDHMQTSAKAPEAGNGGGGGRIIIDRFRLTGARIHLAADRLDSPQTLELEPVTVQNIGRSAGGVGYSDAADSILGAIMNAARNAVRDRLQNAAGEAVRRKLEEQLREKLQDKE
jgi:uncharacterized protein involved in outer membrane biogenesis